MSIPWAAGFFFGFAARPRVVPSGPQCKIALECDPGPEPAGVRFPSLHDRPGGAAHGR